MQWTFAVHQYSSNFPCTSPPSFFNRSHQRTDQQRNPKISSKPIRLLKTRRGLGKNKPLAFVIYYININGFKSKSDSLEAIIISLNKPDVIVLCEIRTVSAPMIRKYFKELGYDTILKKASGIIIAAKFKLNMICATKTVHDYIIAGCVKVGKSEVTIVAVYGPQESEKADLRAEFYEEMGIEVQACIDRGSHLVLVGDFNAKIISDNSVVSGVSPSGSLLKELVMQHSLDVLNFSDKCSGKWTRSQSKKGIIERSIIDYAIVDETLAGKLVNLEIDEDRLMSPYWIQTTKKSGTRRQYSDHNPLILKFVLPRDRRVQNTATKTQGNGWVITADGLDNFRKETKVTPHQSTSGDAVMNFEKYMASLMDSCFKRRIIFQKSHPNIISECLIRYKPLCMMVKVMVQHMKKGKIERTVAKGYISHIQDIQNQLIQQNKSSRVAATMGNLTDEHGKMTVDKFWKLKKSLSSKDQSRASIINRQNVELFSPEAIKKEYQLEFYNRLSHKTIDPMFENFEKRSNDLFQLMLNISSKRKDEPDFTVEEVWSVTLTLNAPSSAGTNGFPPEVYVKAGRGFFVHLTVMLNAVKNKLSIPSEWFELLIVTLFKNKGSRKFLEYYRGIFLSNVVPKIMEKLIKNRISVHLKKVNPLQCGSTENRSTCDILFLLYGVIDHAKYLNKQIYLTFYDYSTCFDSIWLEDSMITLWELGVRSELFALIFKLNEVAHIQVKTPFGLTDQFECPRIVKQGSVLSSNLCSSSTAQICDYNHKGGMFTGTFVINDLLYVDDTTDINDDINETELSHQEVVNFSKCKRLTINHPKCALLTINKKAHHSNPTLTIGDGTIPQVERTKALGDMVNQRGNNVDLIEGKVKSAKAAMTECLSMCNEVTMGLFFVESATILYQSVFLATLLHNCQAWRNLTNNDLKKLEIMQLRYLKRIMRAPLSTPNAFVFLEFGVLPVKYVIHTRQLTFLHHILCLDDNDPVKKEFEAQQLLPFEKNWANEVIPLLHVYHLIEYDVVSISKDSWKRKVTHNVSRIALDHLTTQIKHKTKTKHLSYTSLCVQPYMHQFNHKQASIIFKLRSFSVDCKANRMTSSSCLSCRLCGVEDETQLHIMNCSSFCEGKATVDMSKVINGDVSGENVENVQELCRRVDEFNSLINCATEDNSSVE